MQSLIQRLLPPLLVAGSALSLLGISAHWCSLEWYLFDLASHFQPFYFCFSLLLSAISISIRSKTGMIVSALIAFGAGLALAPYLPQKEALAKQQVSVPALTILSANVLSENTKKLELLHKVAKLSPDCLLLLELSKKWREAAVHHLPRAYQYRLESQRDDGYGLGLYCRRKPERAKVVTWEPELPPHIEADFTLGEKSLRLRGIHTKNPTFYDDWKQRDKALNRLAAQVNHQAVRDSGAAASLVMGDFNASVWSPIYESFVSASGLKDPRRGRGIFLSWKGLLGVPLLPIDHALVSSQVNVTSYSLEALPGSDHHGVYVSLSLE